MNLYRLLRKRKISGNMGKLYRYMYFKNILFPTTTIKMLTWLFNVEFSEI